MAKPPVYFNNNREKLWKNYNNYNLIFILIINYWNYCLMMLIINNCKSINTLYFIIMRRCTRGKVASWSPLDLSVTSITNMSLWLHELISHFSVKLSYYLKWSFIIKFSFVGLENKSLRDFQSTPRTGYVSTPHDRLRSNF